MGNMISFLFKWIKKRAIKHLKSVSEDSLQPELVLHVGHYGWVLWKIDSENDTHHILGSKNLPTDGHVDDDLNRLCDVIQNAKNNSHLDAAVLRARSILIIFECGSLVTFSSGKQTPSLGSRLLSRPLLEAHGSLLLGVNKVTYGHFQFGPENKHSNAMIGYADLSDLQSIIRTLQIPLHKFTSLIPIEILILYQASIRHQKEPFGAILISGNNTSVIAANYKQNIALIRNIPIGASTLVQAVSDANNVSFSSAWKLLSQKTDIQDFWSFQRKKQELINFSLSPTEFAIDTLVSELRNRTEELFMYMDLQLGCGRPVVLQAFGDSSQVGWFNKLVAAGEPVSKWPERSILTSVSSSKAISGIILLQKAGFSPSMQPFPAFFTHLDALRV